MDWTIIDRHEVPGLPKLTRTTCGPFIPLGKTAPLPRSGQRTRFLKGSPSHVASEGLVCGHPRSVGGEVKRRTLSVAVLVTKTLAACARFGSHGIFMFRAETLSRLSPLLLRPSPHSSGFPRTLSRPRRLYALVNKAKRPEGRDGPQWAAIVGLKLTLVPATSYGNCSPHQPPLPVRFFPGLTF